MKLVKVSKKHELQLKAYIHEMSLDSDEYQGCGGIQNYDNYNDWLSFLDSISDRTKMPKDSKYVEGSQYILTDEDESYVYGMINLRHYLNEYLFAAGGHIGYSIRPCERAKGYGKLQLSLALNVFKEMGVSEVLVTCHDGNIRSEKTIRACGGIEDRPFEFQGEKTKRFFIPTGVL